MVQILTSQNEFENMVIASVKDLKLIVIDYFTSWCIPCTQFAPEFEELSKIYEGDTYFAKVDCDVLGAFASQQKISRLPTIKGYLVGQNIFTLTGGDSFKLRDQIVNYIIKPEIRKLFQVELPEKTISYILKITDNILKNPDIEKYRQLKFSNSSVMQYLLAFTSVKECLLFLGFQEEEERLFMPRECDFDLIRLCRNQIYTLASKSPSGTVSMMLTKNSNNPYSIDGIESISQEVSKNNNAKNTSTNELSNISMGKMNSQQVNSSLSTSEQAFVDQIESVRRKIDLYNNEDLILITNAIMETESCILENLSKEATIKRLLRWFKYDFFTWFNTPVCSSCQQPYNCRGHTSPTDDEAKWLASNVELYSPPCKCLSAAEIRFPRYNHPEMLLVTSRTGRCGEWANCFALILRACIYQNIFSRARFIMDWADHVWCEVYLKLDKENEARWIHVDPCEGTYNAPLVYKEGWGKSISYVIGIELINKDVQDVTWRYTDDFKLTLANRKLIRENILVNKLIEYHKSTDGMNTNEIIKELVGFLKPPTSKSVIETVGRTTGSKEWRSQRGELGLDEPEWSKIHTGCHIRPTTLELENNCVHIQYNCSVDSYIRPYDKTIPTSISISGKGEVSSCSNDNSLSSGSTRCSLGGGIGGHNKNDLLSHDTNGWQELAASWCNIQRKVEYDWQIVYMARIEGCPSNAPGEISWIIDVSDTNKVIGEISVFASSAEFNNANVKWYLHNGYIETPINGFVATSEFINCTQVTLTANLTSGDNEDKFAWQHTQLCRQKSTDFDVKTLQIKVELINYTMASGPS